jgi:glycosyltransferase involved in cell wall biosynthesis
LNLKRVLQVTYSLKAAGIETFVVNIHKNINRKEYQFDYATYFPPEKEEFYDSEVRRLGGKIYKLGYKQRGKIASNIKTRINLYKCIKRNKYETVHIHGSNGLAILEVLAAKLAGCQHIIIHSHNSNISNNGKFSKLIRLITKICRPIWKCLCDELLACSNEAANWLYGNNKNVLLIPNGIDTERFCVQKEAGIIWRKENNISENDLLIGQVASFSDAKNHEFSVKLLTELIKENSNTKMVFVGDGPKRKKIEDFAKKIRVYDKIIFNGISANVEIIMNACDVLILPSLYEGLPVVCVEAQYCGVPIIVSDIVTRDVNISDNIYYVPLDNPRNWKNLIMELKGKAHNCDIENDKFDIRNVVGILSELYV